MSIAINNTGSGASTGSSTSWSHTVGGGSGRILIVVVATRGNDGTTIPTVTYNGVAMTQAITDYYSNGGFRAQETIFYMLDTDLPSAGAYTVSVTTSSTGAQHVGGGSVDITDGKQQAPEASNSSNYGSGGVFSSMSTSITTATDNALIVDGGSCDGNATVGSGGGGFGSGQTSFVNANQASLLMYSGSYEVYATAGATSQTQSWVDYACNRGAHCVVVFAEDTGPAVTDKIAYAGQDTSVSATAALVLDVPADAVDGDLLVAFVVNEDDDPDASWTPPSGWTLYVDELDTGGTPGSPPTLSVYYRRADTEPSSYTWTLSASGRGLMGAMQAYRNVDSDEPFDAARTTATGSSGQPNPPSITTVIDRAWVVAAGMSDDDTGYTSLSSGYVERVKFGDDSGSGDGASLGICDLLVAAAGATDPGAFSSSDSEEWAAVTMALKQATPFVAETSENDGSGTSLTVSHTFTAGDNKKLIVFAGGEHSGAFSVSSVTYDGESLTKITEVNATRNVVSAWYLDDADFPSTPGAYNVVITYSLSVTQTAAHVVGLQGAEQVDVEAYNSSTEESSPTSITTTCTTTTDDALLLGCVNSGAGTDSLSPNTGQEVLEVSPLSGFDLYTGAERIPDAGSTSMGWTSGENQFRLAQVVLAVAPFSEAADLRNTFFGWEH